MQASRHIASHSAEPGDRDSTDAASARLLRPRILPVVADGLAEGVGLVLPTFGMFSGDGLEHHPEARIAHGEAVPVAFDNPITNLSDVTLSR